MGKVEDYVIRFGSETDPLLAVDARGRVSLGKLAKHRHYLATVQDSGHILLTPMTILPADHPLAIELEKANAERAGRDETGT